MRLINTIFKIFLLLLLVTSCNKRIRYPLHIDGAGVADFEGNQYKTVVIGDQEWMAENLKSKKYSNGVNISNNIGFEDYKIYNNDTSTVNTYGLYYSPYAVEDTSGICPCNWHMPTEKEYDRLITYLGGYIKAYAKLKSRGNINDGTGLWAVSNGTIPGDNSSGFNAIPAGLITVSESLYMDGLTFVWAIPNDIDKLLAYNIGSHNHLQKDFRSKDYSQETFSYYSIRFIKNLE